MLFTRRFRRVIFCKNRLQIPCPPEFAVKKLQIPVWVSVILAEDKGVCYSVMLHFA